MRTHVKIELVLFRQLAHVLFSFGRLAFIEQVGQRSSGKMMLYRVGFSGGIGIFVKLLLLDRFPALHNVDHRVVLSREGTNVILSVIGLQLI